MNNLNPMQIMQLIQSGNNPQQLVMQLLEQQAQNNPMAASENQSLKFAASQQAQNAYLTNTLGQKAPVPAYVVANPYCNCGTVTNGCF